ncbi:hypothetical protein SAMN05216251_101198 [Actinacidiphila alni]|uniref:Uncharacterized protein n=1 Tax=Actinacidiphila alni TaxID=380248 RepID=A0A1I1X6X7_9ACTN|nr:hypothetical protein [Actinacidiphila alni]SFE02368.1 hypothetical protein SAMN05216251_101198 [Actinacidiphila alni]
MRTSRLTFLAATAATCTLLLGLTACGSDSPAAKGSAHGHAPTASPTMPNMSSASPMPSMDGMHDAPTGNGLSADRDGYRLTSPDTRLTQGAPAAYRFTVTAPDGRPLTAYALDQTRRMHVYAVRSDLTGFQHVHPAMAGDGTWTARLAPLASGTWRVFASFVPDAGPGKGTDFVLSRTVTVPGDAGAVPLPAPAASTTVDGYTVTVKGQVMAGMAHPLTVTVTRNGRPVTDLQPYLGTYAHLTAFRSGDLAFAHLHPTTAVHGDHGGPELTFHAELPASGDWRLFLQFRTGGTLHTAALTLRAG